MRAGLLIYGPLDTVSGGYLYDRKLVEYLRRQGDSVEIISLPWRDYARHLGDNLSSGLPALLTRLSLDVLVQDELNHPSLFWLNRRLKSRVHCPILTIVHHLRSSEARPAWQNRFYRWIERLYLSTLDGYIYNSQTTRQAVQDLLGGAVSQRPSIVAYPAGDRLSPEVETGEIVRRVQQPGPLRLLFLGNVIPRKGLHTLLAALHRVPQMAWELAVAGSLEMDRDYAAAMRRRVDRAGLSERVHFSGPLDDRRLTGILKVSHVMALPSSYEGFGIAYLEGMGFGLPAIATRGGGAGEIITHGQDGYLIEPGGAAALAEHLSALAGDRRRLLAMSLAARQRYLTHPTWDQTARRIRSFLLEFHG